MPTTRPRLTITETDDVAQALDDAAAKWPEVRSRQQLLLRVLREGHEAVRRSRSEDADRRRRAIRRTSGALTGSYAEDHLAALREDWPA